MAIPRSSAALGSDSVTSWPWNLIIPDVGWWTPARILTSVDLPAPLSPTRATTSPAWTSRSMSVSAETAPKFFETPRRLSTGSPMGGAASGLSVMSGAFGTENGRGPPGRVLKAAGRNPISVCCHWMMPSSRQPSSYSPVQIVSGAAMPLSKISALMFSRVTTTGTKSSEGVL